MLPILHTINSVAKLGYQLEHSEQAAGDAINLAFGLVKKMREDSLDMRNWVLKTTRETKEILSQLRELSLNKRPLEEEELKEITGMENQILQRVRAYIVESSACLSKAKGLNPPLTSEQLRPFIDSMLHERHSSMRALEAVTRNIEELAVLKSKLIRDSSQSSSMSEPYLA